MKNKKGLMVFTTDWMVAIIMLILVLLLFVLILFLRPADKAITVESQANNLEAKRMLLQFLKYPVEVDGQTKDMAYVIALADYDGSKYGQLKSVKQDEVLKKLFGNCPPRLEIGKQDKILDSMAYMAIPGIKTKAIYVSLWGNSDVLSGTEEGRKNCGIQ